MRAPEFWTRDGALAHLLAPLGALYAAAGRWRRAGTQAWRAPLPVLCVGNLVAGGTGKTPAVRSLAALLRGLGRRPAVLSRGYGGRLAGPVRVDAARHGASEVGDEPLLLAAENLVVVARDRRAGVGLAHAEGADIVLLDDGFQNPTLAHDLALVLIDGETGFGNGRVIPAGPLREPVDEGLRRADAAVIVGRDAAGVSAQLPPGLPVLRARIEPAAAPWLRGRRVVAFAGIGRPEKFFATLERAGADVVAHRAFSDHHAYRAGEVERLIAEAEAAGALAITTEKDQVRLTPEQRAHVRALPVAFVWDDEPALLSLLRDSVLSPRRHGQQASF